MGAVGALVELDGRCDRARLRLTWRRRAAGSGRDFWDGAVRRTFHESIDRGIAPATTAGPRAPSYSDTGSVKRTT